MRLINCHCESKHSNATAHITHIEIPLSDNAVAATVLTRPASLYEASLGADTAAITVNKSFINIDVMTHCLCTQLDVYHILAVLKNNVDITKHVDKLPDGTLHYFTLLSWFAATCAWRNGSIMFPFDIGAKNLVDAVNNLNRALSKVTEDNMAEQRHSAFEMLHYRLRPIWGEYAQAMTCVEIAYIWCDTAKYLKQCNVSRHEYAKLLDSVAEGIGARNLFEIEERISVLLE